MAVRPYLRSGGAIITRRKNELWYRRRLRLISDDLRQSVSALRDYIGTLSRSQDELSANDRALVSREIAMQITQAKTQFRMPLDPKRTAEYAALLNQRSTDEWWVQQMRVVVDVQATSLPQPRIEDATPRRRRVPSVSGRPTARRRAAARPTQTGIAPLATLNIIRGQARIQTAFANAVRTNVDLITSMPDQFYPRMEEVLFEHVATAQRWETLANRLREGVGDVTNLSDYRAELIARDQSAKMAAAFNQARSESVGIEMYTWQTAGDERVRDTHRENDGKEFRFDTGAPLDDGTLGNPGDDINCRCVALPYIHESWFEEEAA
jgi:SPP1 gp7 family putative phage head morphogenesis protein